MITVLIPHRNQNDTLGRAISSVYPMTEVCSVIVVDDGSDVVPDEDLGVTLIRATRAGVGAALNRGLHRVKTEYVMRQDADDTSFEGRTAALRREFLMSYKVVAVSSWFVHEDRSGKVNRGNLHAFPPELTTDDLMNGWRFPHGPAMYRTDALRKVGGWPENMETSEDHLLHLRLSRIGRLVIVPKVLYFVGDGPNRQTRTQDTDYWDKEAVRRFKDDPDGTVRG